MNPHVFIDAEIAKLASVKNKAKRRRLAKEWRKWKARIGQQR